MNTIETVREKIKSITNDEDYTVHLVDELLKGSLDLRASDIHIESKRNQVTVKVRIDGEILPLCSLEKSVQSSLLSRLKLISKTMVYKNRVPQDGRIDFANNGYSITLRIAFLPTIHGEKVVIRLPDKEKAELDLDSLEFSNPLLSKIYELINQREGMILLTGPASSGKTTTMYSILKKIYEQRGEGVNIATIEDPVEQDLGFINQTEVHSEIGLPYSEGLKSILRQDPNVIMIGEIRDEETAKIAVRAGLTGHLVISTIHSRRAADVFVRLLNMGIEPYLVASSVIAVISQRLVRKLCEKCKQPIAAPNNIPDKYALKTANIFSVKGCAFCNNTGYFSRTGIFELLEVDDTIMKLIMEQASAADFEKYVFSKSQGSLLDEGKKKIEEGITSLAEVMRAI